MSLERNNFIHSKISALLEGAEIPLDLISTLLDENAIDYLDQSLRDKSFDQNSNYELDEFIGDAIVNLCVAEWVQDNMHAKSAGEATLRKHKIQSNRMLGELAESFGLVDMLLIKDVSLITEKTKGDIFEAVIGCLYNICRKKRKDSTALLLCKKVICFFLKQLDLSGVQTWKDPISMFKENYADYYSWGVMSELVVDEKISGQDPDLSMFQVKVFGYPGMKEIGMKKMLLACVKHKEKRDAKVAAVNNAMEFVRSKFGLQGKPNKENPEEIPSLPNLVTGVPRVKPFGAGQNMGSTSRQTKRGGKFSRGGYSTRHYNRPIYQQNAYTNYGEQEKYYN